MHSCSCFASFASGRQFILNAILVAAMTHAYAALSHEGMASLSQCRLQTLSDNARASRFQQCSLPFNASHSSPASKVRLGRPAKWGMESFKDLLRARQLEPEKVVGPAHSPWQQYEQSSKIRTRRTTACSHKAHSQLATPVSLTPPLLKHLSLTSWKTLRRFVSGVVAAALAVSALPAPSFANRYLLLLSSPSSSTKHGPLLRKVGCVAIIGVPCTKRSSLLCCPIAKMYVSSSLCSCFWSLRR